jgi:hypothetical protein
MRSTLLAMRNLVCCANAVGAHIQLARLLAGGLWVGRRMEPSC